MNLDHAITWATEHARDAEEGVAFVAWLAEQERQDPTVLDIGYPNLYRAFCNDEPVKPAEQEWNSLTQQLERKRRY